MLNSAAINEHEGPLTWEPQKPIGELFRYKTKLDLSGTSIEIKMVLGVKRFKDFETSKERAVIECRLTFSANEAVPENMHRLPLPLLKDELDGLQRMLKEYFDITKEQVPNLECRFDLELNCENGLKGFFPRERRAGMGGKFPIDPIDEFRDCLQNEISKVELNDPSIFEVYDLLNGLSSDDGFDIKGAIEALDPRDINAETTALAITLNLLDSFSDRNLDELLVAYESWCDQGDKSRIYSKLVRVAFSELLKEIRSVLEPHKNGKYEYKYQAFNELEKLLKSDESIDIAEWFFILRTMNHVADTSGVERAVLERVWNLELRTLSIPLISQFRRTFYLERVHLAEPFKRAQEQWDKLYELSPDGAQFVLSVCLEYGLILSGYREKFRSNPIFSRILDSFLRDEARYVQTSASDHTGWEMTQIGTSWGRPVLYLGYHMRERLGDLFQNYLQAMLDTSIRGNIAGVRDKIRDSKR